MCDGYGEWDGEEGVSEGIVGVGEVGVEEDRVCAGIGSHGRGVDGEGEGGDSVGVVKISGDESGE